MRLRGKVASIVTSRRCARACMRGLLVLLLTVNVPAHAQPTPPSEPRAAATAGELETLLGDLRAGREAIAPLVAAVDTSAAEAWLAESPLDGLDQRVAEAAPDSSARALWQSAADRERAAAELVRGALNRAALALGGAERLEAAAQRIEEALAGGGFALDSDTTPSEIERQIASLNSRRAEIALELNPRREMLTRLEEQLRGQAATLDELRRDREQQLAAAPEQPIENPALAEASRASRAALERRTEGRIVAAQLDSQALPARIERLRLEIRAHEVESRWLGRRLAGFQEAFNQRSTEEIRALSTDLQRLVAQQPDVQQRFAGQIAELRAQVDELARMQRRIRELQLEREEHAAVEKDLRQTLANVHERLEVGGLSETLGSLFLEEERRLRALGDKRYALREIERELAQSRLRSITLREQLGAMPAPVAGAAEDIELAELDRLRYQATAALVQTAESLTDQLRQAETRLHGIVSLVGELGRVLRETLLWWPSHKPVSIDWAPRVPAALLALLDRESWGEMRTAVVAATAGSPASSLGMLLAVFLLHRGGRGARQQLKEIAEKTRHRYTDGIMLTFRAMGWTLLRALPVPVLLMGVAYRLGQLSETGAGVETLAAVLFNAAIWWLAGHLFLLFTSRSGGVGTVHLEWSPAVVQRLRRNLAWYVPNQLLLIICLGLALGHPTDLVFDVFGRAALAVSGVLSGLLVWNLLAPDRDAHVPAQADRGRQLARVAAAGYATGLVALALAGYLLTVNELLARTIYTAVVLGAGWLGYRLAMRALVLGEMRLRIRRTLEQRARAAGDGAGSGEAAVEDEPHLSIEDINLQTRTLLKVTAGGIVMLALLWVWADVLPALTWLDGVTLWSRNVAVGDAEIVSRVSLQDLLLALFLGALFVMAARNLPGLVEIVLTRSTAMDAAGRYTAAMLLRYALAVIGVVTAFSLVGLRWAELQWMVAALTLGLGFGLQEVVANFFSGIVMLFERPVRVGDTISIGEFSGTVAKIRTRATTITDWDNREIVVPNKMFITERLINWTLSDTITRVTLSVGVSYDTDVDIVRQTLQEVTEQHPRVMAEPAPTVLFLKFGDSALTFEVRAYVEQLADRLNVVSDLHFAIIRAFRARGIEIAFPQMDLHIRDVAPAAGLARAEGNGVPIARAAAAAESSA